MSIFKNVAKIFNPPKKSENKIYSDWFINSSDVVKDELSNLSDKYVEKNFSKEIEYSKGELRAAVGIGSNKFNEFTLDKIVRAITKYAKNEGWKSVMLGVSDVRSRDFYLKINSKLAKAGFDVKSFRDPLIILPQMSLTMNKKNYDFGIYIDWNKSNMSIKILGERGRLLKKVEIEKLNYLTKQENYKFDEVDDSIDRIQIIDESLKNDYLKLISTNLKHISQGNIEKPNTIVINTTSNLVYDIFNKHFEDQEFVHVTKSIKSKKNAAYDITTTTSFRETYLSNARRKAKYIINIDGTGSRMSFAYKHNRTWKYETSGKIGLLLIERLKEQNLIRSGDKLTTTIDSSPILLKYAKSNGIESIIKEDAFSSIGVNYSNYRIDNDYNFSLTPEINSPDAIVPVLILVSYLVNQQEKFSFTSKLKKVIVETHYTTNDVRKKDIKEFMSDVKYMEQSGYIGTQEVKSIKLISEDKFSIYVRVTIDKGYALMRYSKLEEVLETTYHVWSTNQEEAFYKRKEGVKGHQNVLSQSYKEDKTKISKKTLISTLLGTLLVVTILAVIFTNLLDPEQISNAFKAIGENSSRPYPWFLIGFYPLRVLIRPLILKVIFKQVGEDIKYWELFVAAFLGAFISKVSISWIMTSGILYWYLSRRGYKGSNITSALAINAVVISALALVANLYFVSVGTPYILGAPMMTSPGLNSHSAAWLGIGGWAFLAFNLGMNFILAYSKTVHNFINWLIELGMFIIGKEKNYKQTSEGLTFGFIKLRKSFKVVTSSGKNMMTLMAVWVPIYITTALETTLALNTIAVDPLTNVWQTMTIPAMISNANNIFGIVPGGNGTTEWITLAVMKGVVANHAESFGIFTQYGTVEFNAQVTDIANQVTFLDRFTIYLSTAASGTFFIGFVIKQNISKFVR